MTHDSSNKPQTRTGATIGAPEPSPVFSVIIPLHQDGARFRKCLDGCLAMRAESSYEIVVVSDHPIRGLPSRVTQVVTGMPEPTSPGLKRDLGGYFARGAIYAFIDDDAYPETRWLDAAAKVLAESGADAVGGPGLTPPDATRWERLGGAVYESRLGSGPLQHRFVACAPRAAVDLPAYNLIVRRNALEAVGGWKSSFYGGEDTKLCLELVAAGFELRYDPRLVVYHHRRSFYRPHLRQVANVGRHRGYFFRKYPATSRRGLYLFPALGAIGMVPIVFGAHIAFRAAPRLSIVIIAGGWLALSAPRLPKLGVAGLAFPLLLLSHHLAYGVNFLRGVCTPRLADRDRQREENVRHSARRPNLPSRQVG